jgi:hypothetical protein
VPAVLRVDGLRVAIYPNDHPPAEVHVIGPGWVVVINLIGPEVRELIGCNEAEARRVLRLIDGDRETLMVAWRRLHG